MLERHRHHERAIAEEKLTQGEEVGVSRRSRHAGGLQQEPVPGCGLSAELPIAECVAIERGLAAGGEESGFEEKDDQEERSQRDGKVLLALPARAHRRCHHRPLYSPPCAVQAIE